MLSIKGDNNNCDMMKNLILVFGFLFASSAIVTAQAECAAIEPPNGLNKLAAFSIFQSNFLHYIKICIGTNYTFDFDKKQSLGANILLERKNNLSAMCRHLTLN